MGANLAIWETQPGPAHVWHTQTLVGTKNVDFSLVFEAKTAGEAGQHGRPPLCGALRNRQNPIQTSCLGNIGFLFQNFDFFGPGVGESGIFAMPNFKMWLSIFKIWVSSVGDLGIRGDGNYDFDFFDFNVRGRYRKD